MIDSWLCRQSLMLLGLAIEVRLKGANIQGGSPAVDGKGKLQPWARTHKSRRLAEGVVVLTDEDKKLLDALSHIVEWHGRYPIATNIDPFEDLALKFKGNWGDRMKMSFDLANKIFEALPMTMFVKP